MSPFQRRRFSARINFFLARRCGGTKRGHCRPSAPHNGYYTRHRTVARILPLVSHKPLTTPNAYVVDAASAVRTPLLQPISFTRFLHTSVVTLRS